MKKQFLVLSLLMIYAFSCYAQSTADVDRLTRLSDRDLGLHFLKKNRKQKTTGWILLGGGFLVSTVAINSFYGIDGDGSGASVALLLGNAAVIASVPVFISAAKNKGRAEILLRNENVPFSFHSGQSKITSLGIAFPVGR